MNTQINLQVEGFFDPGTWTVSRSFMLHVVATGAVLSAGQSHARIAGPSWKKGEAQATALDCKSDTTKVAAKKYPNRAATQN